MDLLLIANSILLGVGLAMDAFSVSIANAINENQMKKSRMSFIAGTYAAFQFAMPMIGWICVHTIAVYFTSFQKFVPWIALLLLLYIGGKMILDAVRGGSDEVQEVSQLSLGVLMLQGIATSIDALSVGFTISDYGVLQAFGSSLIIAIVTFFICMTGLLIGKKAGEKLSDRAGMLGGVILILIGVEIFVKGVFL